MEGVESGREEAIRCRDGSLVCGRRQEEDGAASGGGARKGKCGGKGNSG